MPISWTNQFAGRTQHLKSSTIRELLKLTEEPDVISFAGGLPAPEVFPLEEMQDAAEKVIRDYGAKAMQYGATEGIVPLREMIAEYASETGLKVHPDNILITSGSQQVLDLFGKIFVNPGEHILVEEPTYMGALQAWSIYGAQYTPVPSDDDGIQADKVEAALGVNPKFMYLLPNFQNPTGVTISLERRKQLVEIAERCHIPILEDDPYGQLRFEGEQIPHLMQLDQANHPPIDSTFEKGNVVYTSTFSKILAPGMRLAWVIGPRPVIQKLVQAKQGADLHTTTLNQYIAYETGKDGFINKHVLRIRDVYRNRRNVMLKALEEHMPAGVRWTHPMGGLFLWATLPEQLNAVELLAEAIKDRVAFVPGDAFYPNGGGLNTMRLNFSNASPDKIEIGIARLGKVIKQKLG